MRKTSKTLLLVSMATWLELSDEPMVIETPPNVLGFIDNAWFDKTWRPSDFAIVE